MSLDGTRGGDCQYYDKALTDHFIGRPHASVNHSG